MLEEIVKRAHNLTNAQQKEALISWNPYPKMGIEGIQGER